MSPRLDPSSASSLAFYHLHLQLFSSISRNFQHDNFYSHQELDGRPRIRYGHDATNISSQTRINASQLWTPSAHLPSAPSRVDDPLLHY
ncbi:hypothetical protein C8Q80DRAFT_721826 [Daedaleopsis nitida]|nr:hypothetical protein C8Q80DRAFT_721826 [Daedaleopsis nitida]